MYCKITYEENNNEEIAPLRRIILYIIELLLQMHSFE